MYAINRVEREPALNLKHQLVAAIAKGDEQVAEEIIKNRFFGYRD